MPILKEVPKDQIRVVIECNIIDIYTELKLLRLKYPTSELMKRFVKVISPTARMIIYLKL